MYVDVIVKVKSTSLISEKQTVNLEFEFKFYKCLSKATDIHSLPEIQLTQISRKKKYTAH